MAFIVDFRDFGNSWTCILCFHPRAAFFSSVSWRHVGSLRKDSNVNVMDETGEILVQNRDYVNRWDSLNGT